MEFFKGFPQREEGQTSVEYILLVGAMAAVIFSILSNLRGRILPGSNPCPPEDRSMGCGLSRIVESLGTTDPNFRYFRIRK
ncbi:MAG: hypothetical protein K9K67_13185 [Bacteriovoracaceae bacterium]|nr:hypothetical protein [Bacteriovoracaceae bacterium]